MKKILLLSIFLLLTLSLTFAEVAFWVGPSPADASWSGEDKLAFTNLYKEGSLLFVSYGEKTIIVEVQGKLPETADGRDFGLTQAALEELGLWGKGVSEVSSRLRSGSILDEAADYTDSGWYRLYLGAMKSQDAVTSYRTLVRKGFKPQLTASDDKIKIYIPYVVDYEKDETIATIKALGFKVEAIEHARNPYL